MPRATDPRFDFRRGLSTAFSQETRDHYELSYASNARMGEYGAISKRVSTQRVHSNAIGSGATILGVQQWKPSARQLVAICNTDLFYKAQGDANFTTVAASFDAANRPIFARHVIAGTPSLFIADGVLLQKWTGSALSTISAVPVPPKFIRVYKGRMFASDGTKTIYWSKVANPEIWASPDGGQANVDTYDAEGVIGMEVVGSSLFLFKNNSIARFTGVSQDDIQIDQQTEGIAQDIGCVAPGTIVRLQDVVFFLSDRGPYIASEAGVQPVGIKIENVFRGLARDYLANAVAVNNPNRQEVWLFLPPTGQTANTVGYCLNYRQQSWTGPWSFTGFNAASACTHERDDQTETVMIGGYDGRVRDADATSLGTAKDDVLTDGTGGTAITMQVDLPTLFFGDPTAVKIMSPTQQIAADLKTSGSLTATFTGDLMSGGQSVAMASAGAGVKQYLCRPGTVGRRITASFVDATSEIVQINGVVLEAETHRRPI